MMRIGYACLTVDVPNTSLKNIRKNNINKVKLYQVMQHNLTALDRMIDYNIQHQIKMFRISSDLIPFGSSLANQYTWEKDFADFFAAIGTKIKQHDIRVSMHPGQYTVLNSDKPNVVEAAQADLAYHTKVLDLLGVDDTNKIVLHIGGIYGDKELACQRFMENYQQLNKRIKKRLVIENDEKNFNVLDVLLIGEKLAIPVVFDNLHHAINPVDLSFGDIIKRCCATWKKGDGKPKIHYSQQDDSKRPGAHSATIDCQKLQAFLAKIPFEVDVMLEVKDKNISVLRCQQVLLEK